MNPAPKHRGVEDTDRDSNVLPADRQHLRQGGNELSGHGILNHDSRLEIGRDFKVVHVENNYHSPIAPFQKREKENRKQLNKAFKRQRRANLSSLKFPQIGLRKINTGDAHTATCRWFLRTPTYLNWLDERQFGTHNGILWIKGKPGAGKSTLMKYVLSQVRRDEKWKLVISFFFYAQGERLERTTIGLYQSLLVQLFHARPHLEKLLDSLPTCHPWTIQSLESLFRDAVLALEDPTLVCFIDALDECEESEIRKMLRFLISLNQDDHRDDISRYIDGILKIGSTDLAKKIRSDIWNSASGVFMWVALVVDILNREYDGGRPDRLRQRLQDIPNDLHDLFHSILTRDEKILDGLVCCIQWILFSTRPLSPQEHYFATLSGVEPDSVLACHSDVSIEDIKRYILGISKGLAEIAGMESPIVQFIHQSVRDYLLNQNGMQKLRQDLGPNVKGYSHEKLRSCCAEYILSVPVREAFCQRRSQNGVVMGETSRPCAKEIALRLPFLEYASRNILRHAEEAQRHAISQSHFLSTFPRAMWIQQVNIYKHPYIQYSSNTTLLYILAEMNCPALIRALVSNQSCFAIEQGRFKAPILAALVTGSGEAVQALLEVQARRLSPDYPDLSLIKELVTKEVNTQGLSQDFRYSEGRSISTHLAQFGSEAIFELFLATEDVDLDLKDSGGATALSWAARCGNEALVKLLLRKGAGIDIQDSLGRTPLSWAAGYGEVGVMRLLLDGGAEVNSRDGSGWTPLSWAVAGHHKATTRLLLSSSADVDLPETQGRSPLFFAVTNGDLAICRILIDSGADVNAQDNLGRVPLSWAVGFNREAVTRLLLDEGARIDVQAYTGGDLLSWASRRRHTVIGHILLTAITEQNT
ncbi:hypothetical protein F4803DRAFT_546958 [Xylaria telfairii]|nr:hypothetical protein F4803DRAFT_546958 [Xylaria telfairii]